jgi:DNA helicase HerA-like ATPase
VVWDPGHDHWVEKRVDNLRDFYSELLRQVKRGPVSLALSLPRADSKSFEVFCACIWQVIDGNKPLVLVVEEAAGAQPSIGKAGAEWGALIREGRKFGLVILATSQRAQELDKTIFTQVQKKYIGCHDIRDAETISKYVGVKSVDIHKLEMGKFWVKPLGPEPAYRIDIVKKGRAFVEKRV